MREEDIKDYKKYISEVDITKYIILDKDENYWYSAEYVDKMLKKQDKEIERLNNVIKNIEKCIDYYAIENDDFSKFYNNEEIEILKIIGSDKE